MMQSQLYMPWSRSNHGMACLSFYMSRECTLHRCMRISVHLEAWSATALIIIAYFSTRLGGLRRSSPNIILHTRAVIFPGLLTQCCGGWHGRPETCAAQLLARALSILHPPEGLHARTSRPLRVPHAPPHPHIPQPEPLNSMTAVLQALRQSATQPAVADGSLLWHGRRGSRLKIGRRSSGPRGWRRGCGRARSPWRSTGAA